VVRWCQLVVSAVLAPVKKVRKGKIADLDVSYAHI
jgi:hypothetical protein